MSSSRLSGIDTQWSMIRGAHDRNGHVAQSMIIERYGPAIKRYLLASLRSEEAADEVFQEFALRLVRGDFRNADSHKGRFRSMIKTALYHMIIDWHRRNQRQISIHSECEINDVAVEEIESPADTFAMAWRDSLLTGAWSRLLQLQEQTGQPYHSVLRFRADHPELSTQKLQSLAERNGFAKSSEGAFRVLLHRARRRFAVLLLEQVRESMDNPADDAVEVELIELGLHHFCKPALSKSRLV